MAGIVAVNIMTIGVPAVATLNVAAADIGGNSRFLIGGGSFRLSGVKQFIDPSWANLVWRNLTTLDAVAGKLSTLTYLGWDAPMEETQLMNVATAYGLDLLLNQPGNIAAISNVYLELVVFP